MKPSFFLTTMLVLCSAIGAAKPESLSFSRFHTNEHYLGPVAKPVFRTEMDREFHSRLSAAAKQRVNFAGHYVLSAWGCGAQCLMGAILDARSGKVAWLPFTVCCGLDNDAEPIEFRPDSTLLIIRGMRNEQEPNGTFYYQYDHDSLKLIEQQLPAKD